MNEYLYLFIVIYCCCLLEFCGIWGWGGFGILIFGSLDYSCRGLKLSLIDMGVFVVL